MRAMSQMIWYLLYGRTRKGKNKAAGPQEEAKHKAESATQMFSTKNGVKANEHEYEAKGKAQANVHFSELGRHVTDIEFPPLPQPSPT